MYVFGVLFMIWFLISSIQADNANGCPDGYYGRDCAYRCSDGCIHNKCISSEYATEICTDGCIAGYSGDSCRSTCPPFCRKCDRYNSSHCLKCDEFHYGSSCDKSCRVLCPLTDCNTNGECLQNDTKEICGYHCRVCNIQLAICKSCVAGFYGPKCNSPCSKTCKCDPVTQPVESCIAECEHTSGHCSHGCLKSFFGNRCQHGCSEHCVDEACDRTTGDCINGCRKGYFGEKCENRCNKYCKDTLCHNETGQCIQGCADGYYGVDCTMKCSNHCLYNICERDKGDCSNGCDDGYFGTKCEKECERGCAVCHKNTGRCVVISMTAETAKIRNWNDQQAEFNSIYFYVIGGAVGFITLIITFVLIICFCRRHSRKEKGEMIMSKQKQTILKPNLEFNTYSEIYDDDVDKISQLSPRCATSSSYPSHGPEEQLVPARLCEGSKQGSSLESQGEMGRPMNTNNCLLTYVAKTGVGVSRCPKLDTSDVVLELTMLTSQEDYMRVHVCDGSECVDGTPQGRDPPRCLSSVDK